MSIPEAIADQVRDVIAAIEREEECVVFLAVESGSRAWGFESTDSDYDVRFLYVRPRDWYLSIDVENRRDVIERPITSELDVSGWDLRKALRLLRKSNPPLLEWLQCSIIYREHAAVANQVRALLSAFYSPRASFHHYLHMAHGNMRAYLRGDVVWRKKYFYVLRPVMAMRWIERDLGPVPIEFERMVDATLQDDEVRRAIDDLLVVKRSGGELDRGPRIPVLSDFLDGELARFEAESAGRTIVPPPSQALDECFRQIIADVWDTTLLVPS